MQNQVVRTAALSVVLTVVATAVGSSQPTMLRVGVTASSGKTRVATMPVEDYVAGVLAGEGEPRAADAAQEALAIAIRTFALANINRHRREGYDLCDTTHCQVLRRATPASTRAAMATADLVLTDRNRPATIYYSAWCGGRSELASEVWPGAIDYAFEPAQRDEACEDEPGWTSTITTRDLERALRLTGLEGRRLRDLRVIARNASGRVARIRADGFSPNELTGHELRMAIIRIRGPLHMKSTAFDVKRTSTGFEFTGRGYGHGVGLCVIGAGHRARAGATAEDILAFYYPGLRIQQVHGLPLTTGAGASARTGATTPPPALPPARAPAPSPEHLALAPPAIAASVKRALDDIAAKAGLKAPASIRITVHPDVEAFGRATGQPWWVSGSADKTGIDFAPLSLLQQRGVLDRTIRHAAAHALLDGPLADRPQWVREGAASYFAEPSAVVDPSRRVTCPTDDELLKPLSAGAHREALARADVCFRRQTANGRSWREVK
jgi:SpoIID/LytB domain protein